MIHVSWLSDCVALKVLETYARVLDPINVKACQGNHSQTMCNKLVCQHCRVDLNLHHIDCYQDEERGRKPKEMGQALFNGFVSLCLNDHKSSKKREHLPIVGTSAIMMRLRALATLLRVTQKVRRLLGR